MWNTKLLPNDMDLIRRFSKHATIAGAIMALVGLVMIFEPLYASLFTVSLAAWLMVFSGVSAGFFTFQTNRGDMMGWLKAVILIGTGLFILFYPKLGIVALGMLFAIYFLLDGFSGIAMGSASRPAAGWWLWILNGLLSLVLAVIFLLSWKSIEETAWLIGIFVGISLFFDGFTLLFMGNVFRNMKDE
ncbi:MAG TPA: hypothetical protein ENK71_00840 [Epsilonproteobacteria bacterium]|nr:hypothetical protein [Campylobacterota bacterium]